MRKLNGSEAAFALAFQNVVKAVTVLLAAVVPLTGQECIPGFAWPSSVYFTEDGRRFAAMKKCLEAGADPNAQDMYGYAPLHHAANNGHLPTIWLLLKAGAHPDIRSNLGDTPLTRAIAAEDERDMLPTIRLLLELGADPNNRGVLKFTPLHDAAMYSSNPAVFRALVKAGADVNAVYQEKDGKWKTPLSIAKTDVAATTLRQIAAEQSVESDSSSAPCPIPGYVEAQRAGPEAARRLARNVDFTTLGLPWCGAGVGFQVRSFAIKAAMLECSIVASKTLTPQQIGARRRQIGEVCRQLDAAGARLGTGGRECSCP